MFKDEIVRMGIPDFTERHQLPDGARLHHMQYDDVISGDPVMQYAYGRGEPLGTWFDSEPAARMAWEIAKATSENVCTQRSM